ncbi:TGF-beta propeptide [compost metagenome]
MKRILALFAFLSCYSVYSQMEPTATLYAAEDGFTSASVPSGNFGSLGSMSITKSRASIERSFLKFNLSSIPSNAVITSAVLRLTPNGTENVTAPNSNELYLDVCNTSWTEAGLTHASDISNNTLFGTITASTLTLSKREFQVKDHVQAMVEGRLPNQGWRIRWSSETVAIATTAAYFTKETATESNRPQLIIQYYLRSSVSAATIVHTSALISTDGSISPTVINGSSTTKTFRWYDASGTQIATTQNLTGVGKGWYGLEYSGTADGDITYQAFLVGTECEDVSVTFNPGPNYMDDTRLVDGVEGSGNTVVNYTQANYGSSQEIKTDKWANFAPYNSRNLLRFRLWIDPNCQITTANMTLYGIEHDPNTRPNDSELLRVTSAWSEYSAAQTNAPTSTSTGKINIAGVPLGNANVTLNISSFFNLWKANNTTNYGMLLQLQSYAGSYTRMQFNSSDIPAGGSRLGPKVEFSIKANACDISRKGTVTVVDNDQALKKNVSVKITAPSWSVSPYRYVISDQAISDPRGVLKYLNDSVFDPDLDSMSFYRGTVNASAFDFGGLEYGTYNIAVFDNTGKRIFERTNLDLYPAITYNASTNATVIDNNMIRPNTAANATCEINAFVNTNCQGTVKLNPTVLSGNQYYGFLDVNRTLSSSGDIRYGFFFSGSNIYTIKDYVQNTKSFKASVDKYVTMSFINDSIIFSNDSLVFDRVALPTGYSLKLGGVMNAAARTRVRVIKTLIKPFFLMIPGGTERTCAAPKSNFQFQLSGFFFNQFGNYNYQLVANNTNESVTSYSGSGVNNGIVTVNNVPPGVYTLSCTQSSGAAPVTLAYTVYIGVQASWFPTHPNYTLSPNSYSLKRDNVNQISTYSSALSTNILPAGAKGWVWFNPVVQAFSGSRNEYLTIADNFGNLQAPSSSQTYLSFRKVNAIMSAAGVFPVVNIPAGVQIVWRDAVTANTGSLVVPDNAFVTIEMTGSIMRVKANNVLVTSLTQPTGFIRLKANSNRFNEGFKDVHTTFVCTASQTLDQVGYYELSRDYTAGYATSVEGKVKFTFDEEYAMAANKYLQYVVYDDTNLEIASGFLNGTVTGGATALTYDFDDNRCILVVSSIAGTTIGKYYHLELTTTTGQKRYLRFLYKN